MSELETSPRPKKRPKEVEDAAAEDAAVKRGNNESKRKALQDKELVDTYGHGGMATPDKPRGCGAAQTSGFRGGETY